MILHIVGDEYSSNIIKATLGAKIGGTSFRPVIHLPRPRRHIRGGSLFCLAQECHQKWGPLVASSSENLGFRLTIKPQHSQ